MRYLNFIAVLLFLSGCFGITPQKTGKEGKPMPNFNILLSDSSIFNTSDIPVGQPIVLFYFSPHCPYCKAVIEDILEEMDDLNSIKFYFVTSYQLRELQIFQKEYQLIKYPNITTGVDTAHFVHDYFNAVGVPYTAIFSKNKILNNAFMGKISTAQLKKEAEE